MGTTAAGRRAPTRSRHAGGLLRPLAHDAASAAYWRVHLRIGVGLTVGSGLTICAYALLTPERPARGAVLGVAFAVMLLTPALLAVPVVRLARTPWGALFLYAWSTAATSAVLVEGELDGGAGSPLALLLFVSLGFAAMTYPPLGVAVVGLLTTGSYLALVAVGPAPPAQMVTTAGCLLLLTMTCAVTSHFRWRVQDVQSLLARRLAVLAETDGLTGCRNHRAFHALLGAETARAIEQRTPLAVCLVDLDGFKAVNDRHGHAAGDALLADLGGALCDAVRTGDVVGRLGGDEFAVLLPGATPAEAGAAAERLHAVACAVGSSRGVTASIGLSLLIEGQDAAALLARADAALYAAKAAGRNGVVTDATDASLAA